MDRNYELELRRIEDDLREAKLEKEKFKEKLAKEFKLTKELLEELQTEENPDPEVMKALSKKILRILERNGI